VGHWQEHVLQAIQARLDETKGLGKKGADISFLDPDEYDAYRRCHTVWFNAWKYSHEKEILAALVEAILRQMRLPQQEQPEQPQQEQRVSGGGGVMTL
jgi:hypothetical protein